jgi:hypothetical protein
MQLDDIHRTPGWVFVATMDKRTRLSLTLHVLCPNFICLANVSVLFPRPILRAGRCGNRIPAEARYSAPIQNSPGAHPSSYAMATGSLQGIKRPGRGVDHPPPPSRAEVKERVELYLCSPFGFFAACSGVNCTFTFMYIISPDQPAAHSLHSHQPIPHA